MTLFKKIVPFFFQLLIYQAEAQQIFQKSYFTDTVTYSAGNSIVKLSNGDYLALGWTGDLPDYDVYLLRLDSIGDILWSKTYATPFQDRTTYLTATDDANFLITGFHFTMFVNLYTPSFMIKIDESGNILWSRIFLDSLHEQQQWLKKTISVNNAYYSAGTSAVLDSLGNSPDSLERGVLVKVDSSGQFAWAKQYGSSEMMINDFVSAPGGGFVLTGQVFIDDSLGGGYPSGIYFKVDSAGNPEWAYKWDTLYPEPNVIMDAGDGYLIGGRMTQPVNIDAFIFKIDYNGNLIWSKRYGNAGTGSDNITLITKLYSGKYAFSNGGNVYFVTDSLSNDPIYHGVSNDGYGRFNQLIPENNGGLTALGIKSGCLFISKTDSSFYTCINYTGPSPFTTLSIIIDTLLLTYNSIQLPLVSENFIENSVISLDSLYCNTSTSISASQLISFEPKVFPNPFKEKLLIELENKKAENFSITIFDFLGRSIYSQITVYNNLYVIDTNHLVNGIYVLQIKSDNYLWKKTIIKF